MSDIFISYAREDQARVKILAEALAAQGWSVWWDPTIPYGSRFDEVIEAELEKAGCVIVVWSRHSVISHWVREEAHEARSREILIPVAIDDTRPPFGYRRFQAAFLGDWEPGDPFPVFDKLLDDIAAIIGRPPIEAEEQQLAVQEKAQQATLAASKAEAVLKPPRKRPELPPIEDIRGWPSDKVKALQEQTAEALGMPVLLRDGLKDGSEGPEMVVIPAGRFLMGSPEDEPERCDDERQHPVTIQRPFAIGKYEVTFAQYDRFAEATGRDKPNDRGWGRGRRPVINVDWHDAVVYAEWLSEQAGQEYRLPTEAEWEYAARAGTATPFHFGETISTDQANYDGNYTYAGGSKGDYRKKTVEVGQFPANAWGLHDVHGNVWEWTCSEYDKAYGGAELEYVGKNDASALRVIRGGSWGSEPRNLRSATRGWFTPGLQFKDLGFRLAMTLTL